MSGNRTTLTVSEITAQIKGQIESQFSRVWVRGEISNFKHHSSGHMYFTVKDAGAELRCVMFRGFNQSIHFKPEDGMEIMIQGKITVYEPRGQYQLMVQLMEPAGIGTLYLAFEALKKELMAEGLFDKEKKLPIPAYPQKIGIVTSPTGAALRDMHNILKRRAPQVEIVLRPALVQGDGAASDIIAGILDLESMGNIDLIIIGRGGGSLEDLWAFNEEALVRAIGDCSIPIVSAVGHETDVTISDLVADLRAPTPSAAAELASISISELAQMVQNQKNKLHLIIENQLNQLWQKLDHLIDRQSLQHPRTLIMRNRERLDIIMHQLDYSMHQFLSMKHTKLKGFEKELTVLNPLDILHRGYSIAFSEDGSIVRQADDLNVGAPFVLKTGSGSIAAEKKKTLPNSE
ncbi:MAG: exodeoxyribonuclease VII large subunit [Candidatus Marinimicrobia bacterium]|nr:exodeoxyribonuclease VII large subunit [Candidatus Neomarinimicrobiota bacterium]